MAEFTITFDEEILVGPEYESYNVSVITLCNDDAQPRYIKFNDIVTGDFVVGFNWFSPNGLLPLEITFLNFTDATTQLEISTGVVTTLVMSGNSLRDNSTNTNILNFPYSTPINNLSNIVQVINNSELTCSVPGPKYKYTRTRRLEYYIRDEAGQDGPIREAIFINTNQ